MTGNENYVNWKTREIISGKRIMGGFLPLRTNVCCKANLVCSDWEAAAWCCWNRASKEKERKLPFHRWESSNFFFSFFKRRSFRANSLDLFVLLLLLFNAGGGGGGGGTALLVWNDIIFSIRLTCAREATPFYTAAVNAPPPAQRRPLSLWIVHGEQFFIRKKIVFK